MNIAIIAWGSLIWDPRSLPYREGWKLGGPALPLEFSRVSKDGRLTLVIDGVNGVEVPTRFAVSTRGVLNDAIADLRDREGTVSKCIGFVECTTGSDSAEASKHPGNTFHFIRGWAEQQGFDAAIWTALPSSFKIKTGEDFCVEAATAYLRGLPTSTRDKAIEYIEKAPPEVATPLREHLIEKGLISQEEKWGI